MKDIKQLKKITSLTAISVSAVVLIVIPSIYFLTAFNQKLEWFTYMARSLAGRLSELIYTSPDTWQFKQHNIQFVLSYTENYKDKLYYLITDNQGLEVIQSEMHAGDRWLHSVSVALTDGINQVGTLKLSFELMPLLWETFFVSLFALTIAIVIYYVLRLLPFAHLERALSALSHSRALLSEEVEAKNLALSQQQKISKQMEYQSLHDSLTHLPNRKMFNHTIMSLFGEQSPSKKACFCVLMLDLDRFKEINDALGHQVGDLVLIELAKRLRNALPGVELIARLGGDEYAVLTKDCHPVQLEKQLKAIFNALKKHFNLEGFHLSLEASVGVSCFPEHGTSREVLVRHADIAMYHAKTHGLNWSLYESGFDTSTPDRLRLVSDLRDAISNEKLTLQYQPKLCLKTNTIVSMEALARWQHPEFGMIPPDVFIPIAEQSNLINSLTTWLVDTALKQLKALHLSFNKSLSVAVNISARNLQDAKLTEQLSEQLNKYEIEPGLLTLEVTETMMMLDPEQSKSIIEMLSALGIKIAIDDFGTGYSSLAYLKRLAVDQVKIDRSFTMNMVADQDDRIIVKSTIDLAHSLGIEVVAEGIEEYKALEYLQSYGCEYGQGYFISKPIPSEMLPKWLETFDAAKLQ